MDNSKGGSRYNQYDKFPVVGMDPGTALVYLDSPTKRLSDGVGTWSQVTRRTTPPYILHCRSDANA